MIKPPILKNEIERLRALLDYQVLETPSEKDFDDIVLLASKICEAPIALISLIDENRQWFKARVGIDVEETPREMSFCGHAIATPEIMIIPDASKDERFFDNPAVIGGMVKFYAGAPLRTPSGQNIGTLCIAGPDARNISREQEEVLSLLSKQVITLLEYRKKIFSMNDTLSSFKDLVTELDLNSDRMQSLGGLATSVAHEINNPLAIIMMTSHNMKKLIEKKDLGRLDEGVKLIEETVIRMANVVRELRNLSESRVELPHASLEKSFTEAVQKKK